MPESHDFTQILHEIGAGADRWSDALPLVYDELHRSAQRVLARGAPAHSLDPTALVHDAWARLREGREFNDRGHFHAVAAVAMRGLLVDRARERAAKKRGGDAQRVTLHSRIIDRDEQPLEVLDLHEALLELAALDARQARIVELRVFGGMTTSEVAAALGVGTSTVDVGWRMARAWLSSRLRRDEDRP